MKVQTTTNYDKFELLNINRDVLKTAALEKSMKRYGWIPAYPCHVVKNGNGKLKIKAGHHRFTVAKKLGIGIKYVVCDDNSTVHELEKATRAWTVQDYLTSYIRSGYPEYVKFKEFVEKTGLPLNACISMLGGQWAGSGNHLTSFKDGTYQIKDYTHAEIVAGIMKIMRKSGIKWAAETLPVLAISKIVITPDIDLDQFVKKIKTWSSLVTKQSRLNDYLSMFEDVYNHRARTRLPLAHIVIESARKRQQTFGQES